MPSLAELPGLIRARRIKIGMSQAALARSASVSRTTLSHVEQGKAQHAQLNVIGRIMSALELAPRLSEGNAPDAGRLLARMRHQAKLHELRERHLRLAVDLAADAKSARSRIAGARERVALWRKNETCSPFYVDRWAKLLALPPPKLGRAMASLGEWEDALFQNSPWFRT